MQAYRLPLVTLFFALLSLVLLLPAVHARDQLVSRHQHARMIKLWGPPPAARRDLIDGLGLGGSKDNNDSSNGAASSGAGGAGNVAAAPTPTDTGTGSASAPGGTASSPSAGAAPTSPGGTGASPSAPPDANNGGGAAPGDGNTGGNSGNNNNNNGGGIGGIVGSLTSGVGGIITGGNTPPSTPPASQSTPSGSPTDTGSQSQTSSLTQPTFTPVAPASPVSGIDSTPSSPTVDAPPETQSSHPVTTPLTPQQQQQAESQTRIPKSTQVILIAVGSSVVGAAIIWTLIRKWKFRATRDRLATIDWSPDNSGDNMEDRQRFSFISQRSGSGVDAQSQFRRNMFAPDGPSVAPDFPPPHDFTAGPVRGATPQPGLQRGYSGNRGQYGY